MSKVVQGIYLLLGANLGDPPKTFTQVRQMLNSFTSIGRQSSLYITPPWKMSSENLFYNQVLEIETSLSSAELLTQLLDLESAVGRVRLNAEVYEDRLIDIDILLFGDQIIDSPSLTIPQKGLSERSFALMPLLELAPQLLEPGTGIPYQQHLDKLGDEAARIKKLAV